MTEDETNEPPDVLLHVLHPLIGTEVHAVLTLRTGETIARVGGELAHVSDADPVGDMDPLRLALRIGDAELEVEVDGIRGLQPIALPSLDRVGICVDLPLYDLTIHWSRQGVEALRPLVEEEL
jgi:hypothetical protein